MSTNVFLFLFANFCYLCYLIRLGESFSFELHGRFEFHVDLKKMLNSRVISFRELIPIYLFRLGECNQKRDVRMYINESANYSSFACRLCHLVYSNAEDLTSHERSHNIGTDELRCRVCQTLFSSKTELKVHLLDVHGHEFKHFCFECGRGFRTYISSNSHSRLFHRPEISCPVCPICGKTYVFESHLQTHLKKHSMEQPFRCDVCGRSYKYKWHFKSHKCK